MSVASELSALNGYILGAYDEINDKGGAVPANKNMANLASAISSISSGTPTTITPLQVTENGTYTAPTGTAYSPVTVNVSASGGAQVATGTFTPTSDITIPSYGYYLFAHNCGFTPKAFFMAIANQHIPSTTAQTLFRYFFIRASDTESPSTFATACSRRSSSSSTQNWYCELDPYNARNKTTSTVIPVGGSNAAMYMTTTDTFEWIAIG